MFETNPFIDANKAAVDQFYGFANSAFEGVEALTTLNLQAAKTVLAESAESTQAVMSARSPEEVIRVQAAVLQSLPEKSVAYANQFKSIVESSFAAQRAAAEAKVADVQAQFVDAMANALKNAPGSENTMALVKSAVAASNNAYEGVNKASKQVADVVEANVSKLTEGATKASRNVA
jgi:phasin family protein